MLHNLVIEPRNCPRCGIRRTTRALRSTSAFCFNCHMQWDVAANPFNQRELARLHVYRSAVRNGLYRDW